MIVGRSNIVGKPLAVMLTQANATVTICHTGSWGPTRAASHTTGGVSSAQRSQLGRVVHSARRHATGSPASVCSIEIWPSAMTAGTAHSAATTTAARV